MPQTHTIGRMIGGMSLAFGLTDILAGERFGRGIGAGEEGGTLFKTVGAREVVTGAVGLAFPLSSIPVWTRFAADLADMAALTKIVIKPNPKRSMALTALAIVAGVAAIDFVAARAMDRPRAARP